MKIADGGKIKWNSIKNVLNKLDNISELTIDVSYKKYGNGYEITTGNWLSGYSFGSFRLYFPLNILKPNEYMSISYKYKVISGNGDLKPKDWNDVGFVKKQIIEKNDYTLVNIVVKLSNYDSVHHSLDLNTVGQNSKYILYDLQLVYSDNFYPYRPYNASLAAIKSDIPSIYERVEYLESTGIQYIDTGIINANEYKTISSIKWNKYTGERQLFGTLTGTYYFGIAGNGNYEAGSGTESTIKGSVDSFDRIVTERINTHSLHVYKDSTLITSRYNNSANTLNYYLFALNNNNKMMYACKCSIRNFIIFNNNILVRNFIPCIRKSDKKPGMYDTVTKQFFTNQGTGEFLYGQILK